MESNAESLKIFTTRVRQLMLSYSQLREENTALKAQLDARGLEIKDLQGRFERLSHDYEMLKAARMLQITDGDVDEARKRLNKLIRNLSRSIAMLSGQV
ncbi:hypothetical protein PRBRB14_15900 [Hallella multisaccharivorax DSM 17128]|uniref:Uncharacterized protein n=2 Tax=Hallella multisaccharivorax TaxID=310514 RepID=F8NBQ0_9BACT|nr:hypothetical protein Premu_2658 [Hallella multisaccharivorax DSM 17128]GJG30711.1 hypothetical protein PRBRB14_15900 [Hallella multisaccharivorax DSM 17128]